MVVVVLDLMFALLDDSRSELPTVPLMTLAQEDCGETASYEGGVLHHVSGECTLLLVAWLM